MYSSDKNVKEIQNVNSEPTDIILSGTHPSSISVSLLFFGVDLLDVETFRLKFRTLAYNFDLGVMHTGSVFAKVRAPKLSSQTVVLTSSKRFLPKASSLSNNLK